MWPFKRKPILDSETVDWQFDCYRWLLTEFGSDLPITIRRLILPKPGFFETDGEKGHALAERLFNTVKSHAGMAEWPVRLVADLPTPKYPEGTFQPQPIKHAAGTFSILADQTVEISYQPQLLSNPQQLIATFAHELAHFVLSTATTKPPCDDDEIEFLTDLTAVYLGFGVFMSNNVLHFNSIHDLGGGGSSWSYTRTGYLPENDLVHATAIFLKLSGESSDDAVRCLKPGLGQTLRVCLDQLRGKTEQLEELADNPPPSPVVSNESAEPDLQPGEAMATVDTRSFPSSSVGVTASWQQPTSWPSSNCKPATPKIKD